MCNAQKLSFCSCLATQKQQPKSPEFNLNERNNVLFCYRIFFIKIRGNKTMTPGLSIVINKEKYKTV